MYNIAIIGAGAISRTHIDGYMALPELCQIKAVCNWHIDRAENLIQEKNISGAKAYQSIEDAVNDVKIDAVSICLPPAEHAKTAIWALEHGINVLCEKPMAGSLEECDAMIEAAEKNNVKLAVVCQLRCTNTVNKIKTILESGEFGKPLYTKVDSMWWRGSNYHKMFWRGTWKSEGGGVLTIQAIHHLDLTQYLLGMPKKVTAVISNVGHDNSETEDTVSATLEYPNSVAQFNAALVAHGEKQDISVYTDKCKLSLPWQPDSSKQMDNGYPEKDCETIDKVTEKFNTIPDLAHENHEGQICNFLKAIAGEEELISDGYEGRKVIELITAVYLSALEGKTVELPLDKSCVLYSNEGKANSMPHFHEKTESVSTLGDGAITFAVNK